MNNNQIPADATNLECFCIKNGEAFIGYKIPNGNFHFVQIPYTGIPQNDFSFLQSPIYQQQKKELAECEAKYNQKVSETPSA